MRLVLIAASALVFGASASFAADDVMATAYGNTIVSISTGGMEAHTYYNADHTFSGKVPAMGFEYKGTWSVDANGHICRTFDPPVPGRTNPDCDAEAQTSHAVGDKWTAADGAAIALVAGVN
jgi:hypothetical protein